ncbi:MAG: hypothetical protein IJD10_03410 [Clostridia bacterium]|nr:hypothetical protein [Clostridia bacterium]
MTSKIFNRRLFVEGIRQLKIPGTILTIFYTLMAVVYPMDGLTEDLSLSHASSSGIYQPSGVGFFEMFPIMDVTFFLVAPFLVFWLFRFLTSRKNSDFYHALPVSSSCLTVSFFASVLAWTAAILIISASVGTAIYGANPWRFTVDYGSVLRAIPGKIALSVMTGGYALLGVALTGTAMSGLVATVLLPYLPMLAHAAIMDRLYDAYTSTLSKAEAGVKGNTSLLAFINNYEDFLQLNLMNWFDEPLHEAGQIIYTLVCGIAVFLIALLLLRRRKSETAGRPAMNVAVHHGIRIAGTLFIMWFLGGSHIAGGVSLAVIGVALTAYFAYELITTRRWYNLLRSLVWLPVVALLYFVPFWVGDLMAALFR